MSYQFNKSESLVKNVRRVVVEEIDGAIEELNATDGPVDKRVHEARKHFKKIRAVLQLIRKSISNKTFQRENGFYRDTARRLAGAREGFVALETLKHLAEQYPDQLPEAKIKPLEIIFTQQYEEALQDLLGHTDLLEEIVRSLEAAKGSVKDWKIDGSGYDVIEGGLKRTYKRGQQAMAYAYATAPDAANFHEWRKRVKQLWYHNRLLAPVWESGLGAYVSQLDDLSDLLGLEHDYAELKFLLLDQPHEAATLLDLLDMERARLRYDAWLIGKRIYAEKPGAYVKRYRAYWRVWRAEDEQSVIAHMPALS